MDVLIAHVRGVALLGALALALVLVPACIGTSPEQQAADELGPDTSGYDSGPFHRTGFPCTRCHGDRWWQNSPPFDLAGTIYARSGDRRGVGDAVVVIKDAAGQEIRARSNRVGNFFLVRGGSQTTQFRNGWLQIPNALKFPLRVSVELNGEKQEMRGSVWRERSCSECHRGAPDANSNGPVFALGAAP